MSGPAAEKRWKELQEFVAQPALASFFGQNVTGVRVNVEATLGRKHHQDFTEMIDRWMDEASQAALDGRPERARYIDYMARRATGQA